MHKRDGYFVTAPKAQTGEDEVLVNDYVKRTFFDYFCHDKVNISGQLFFTDRHAGN